MIHQDYLDNDLDQFHADIGNKLKPTAEIKLRLLRRGFLTWRVTAIDLGTAPVTSTTTSVTTSNAS